MTNPVWSTDTPLTSLVQLKYALLPLLPHSPPSM